MTLYDGGPVASEFGSGGMKKGPARVNFHAFPMGRASNKVKERAREEPDGVDSSTRGKQQQLMCNRHNDNRFLLVSINHRERELT